MLVSIFIVLFMYTSFSIVTCFQSTFNRHKHNYALSLVNQSASSFHKYKNKINFALYSGLNQSPLELCDENANIVMEEIKSELGTLFGYDDGRL